jgi:uncharacterized membrane protein (UPF0127 family)
MIPNPMHSPLAFAVAWLVGAALVVAGDAQGAGPTSQTQAATLSQVTVTYPNGNRLLAEVADTPATRASGLMFRDRLDPDRGMLFVFEEADEWSFWMKNTKVPLDILWLGPDKRIVYIEENVPGCRQDPCPEYKSNKKALYVLELLAGTVKREKLAKGMTLQFNLPKKKN